MRQRSRWLWTLSPCIDVDNLGICPALTRLDYTVYRCSEGFQDPKFILESRSWCAAAAVCVPSIWLCEGNAVPSEQSGHCPRLLHAAMNVPESLAICIFCWHVSRFISMAHLSGSAVPALMRSSPRLISCSAVCFRLVVYVE